MKLYKIKPLEWKYYDKPKMYYHTAETEIYAYTVILKDGRWEWGWRTAEEYYTEWQPCESLEDGKQKAWEHWVQRLLSSFITEHKEDDGKETE